MATTTPDALWSPDLGTAFVPVTDLAHMQDTVQTALNNKVIRYRSGPDSGRTTPVGWTPAEGDKYYSTDTDREWFYNGTTWLPNDPGSYLIRPTSVVGGTLGANGVVTFTAATTVSLNGVFSSRFSEYELQWTTSARSVAGGTNVEQIRLRNAGVDNSAAVYGWRRFVSAFSGGIVVTGAANASDNAWTSMASQGYAQVAKSVRLVNPGNAVYTRMYGGKGVEADGAGSFEQVVDYSGEHKVASAFDGFTIYPGAGNFTGTLRVIGYA